MAGRMRKPKHEEHADESWLIPYADILTLLLALFIVLFASSKVDEEKFKAMAAAFNEAFSGNRSVLNGEAGITNMQVSPTEVNAGYMNENDQLTKTKQNLDQYITAENLSTKLETELLEDGLAIRIRETALFPSGSAVLLPESRKIAGDISKMLEILPQRIVVSGHTDNVPINNGDFQSNWDLGTRRSLNFLKLMLSTNAKLKPERFIVAGYSEYNPVADNTQEEGRAKNRRVEILILRSTKSF